MTWSHTHRNLKQGLIKKTKTEWIYVHEYLNHFAVHPKLILCKSIILQLNKKQGLKQILACQCSLQPQSENKRFFFNMVYAHN